jgi:purple acid phosphatase-like protein/calcineurin-like phosphoesterase family protein
MRRSFGLLLLLAGCGGPSNNPGPDAGTDGGGYQFGGGALTLPQCGYAVTTRDGASPPAAGSPMLGADATPWGLHLGLIGDPTTTLVVVWRTNDDTTLASTVQYGVGGMTDQTVEGITFSYPTANQAPGQPPVRVHQGHLCGLQPGTTYSYRVGGKDGAGNEKWSPVFSFHTAPPKGQMGADLVVGVIGDTRDGYDQWGRMLATMQATAPPDLILFSGDATALGPIQADWDTWLKAAEPVLRQVPMVLAQGNHEVSAINYYSEFAMPGDEEFYGLDYGPLHVAVLDDTPMVAGDVMTRGTPFLDHDLTAAAGAPWKLVLHHRPMYSSGTTHGSNLDLRAIWAPVVDAHQVDLVLNGHEHNYERTRPLRGDKVQATAAMGTTYVIAGSAGAPLYDVGTSDFTAVSKKTYSFLVLKARVGKLVLSAYDGGGAVLDTLTLTK